MEQERVHFGVWFEDEALGIEGTEYPLNYHFFAHDDYIPAFHNGEAGFIVGRADKVTEKDPGGVVLFASQGGVSGIHNTRVEYE